MPFQSKKQQAWAFATDQPFAEEWASKTDQSSLPKKKNRKKEVGDRLNARRFVVKALSANWGAHSGETIRGNLKRGPGGRFGSSGGPATPNADRLAAEARAQARSEAKKPAAGRKGRGGKAKPKKVVQTPEQRQAARDQAKAAKLQANQKAVSEALAGSDTLGPTGTAAIISAAAGTPMTEKVGAELEALGYAEKNKDGSYHLSPEGKKLAAAANRGDIAAAREAATAASERAQAAEEPKAGGGGGGGSKELTDEQKAEQASAKKLETATTTAAKVGLPQGAAEVLAAAAEGRPANVPDGDYPAIANRLLALGFTTEGDETQATDAGRRALAALSRGDASGYHAAVQDAQEKAQRLADKQVSADEKAATRAQAEEASMIDDLNSAIERDAKAREVEAKKAASDVAKTLKRQAQEQTRAARQAKLDKTRADRETARKARAAERAARAAEVARRKRLNRVEKGLSSIMVFKDRNGRPRWLQTSSAAYRDLHGETVTKAAMRADCDYADRTGDYGPLLWWHTKFPLGDCDFNAVSGPILIESGTFRKPEYAEAVQRESPNLAVSIGFLPWPGEPKADGLYTFIRRKERSILPKDEAANPFTRLIVYKENKMDPTRLAQLAKLLNVSETDAAQIVENEVNRVSKEAAGRGLVEKAKVPPFAAAGASDASTEEDDAETDMTGTKTDADVEAGLADDGTAGTALDPLEAQDDMGGSLFTPQEMQEIAGAIAPVVAAQVVEALMPQLNLEDRMRKMADEIKNLVAPKPAPAPAGGNVVTKEADPPKETETELKIKSLEAQIAELKGDQPVGSVHRPSTAGEPLVAEVIRMMMSGRDLRTKNLGLAGSPAQSSDPIDSIVDSIIPGGNSPAA